MEVKEVNALRISLFENDWLPERPTELTSIEGLEKDLWGFGYLWDEVVQTFSTVEELSMRPSKISEMSFEPSRKYFDLYRSIFPTIK